MKFAKSMYANFDNNAIGLKLFRGQVFAVTKEIEESAVYQTSVATKNFVPIQINNMHEFDSKVINKTAEIRAEFAKSIAPVVETNVEATVTVEVEDTEITTDTAVIEEDWQSTPTEDEVEEVIEEIEETEEVEEVDETVPFTKEAGNVKNAIAAIESETDMMKLNDALIKDERVSVKKALNERIAELE